MAIYSHISDQVGPFNAFVSHQPRMSHEVGVGNIRQPRSVISSTFHHGVCITIGKAEQALK